MPSTDTSASPFTIVEQTGDRRSIRLVGRALPYRPFSLKTKQRVELDWYAGMPEATATVLGPKEEATELTGAWKDKFLGTADSGTTPPFSLDGVPVLDARTAVNLMDQVCRFGQLLEVKWFDTTRQGYLTSFEKRWDTTHDVEWTMEFSWIGRGEQLGPMVSITGAQLGDTVSALQTQLANLDDVGTPEFGLSTGFLSGIQNLQHSIEDAINNVEDTVQNLTTQVLTPVNATRGIIASLSGIGDECSQMVDFVNSSVAGAFNANTPVEGQSFSERLAAEDYREELKAWALEMRRIAIEQQSALDDQINTGILADYIAQSGQDLRDVSRLFYGTPFEWRRIMLFNGLSSAELTAGQDVLVPKLNPAEAGQLAGNLMPTLRPSCVLDIKLKFDEALTLGAKPEPTTVYDRVANPPTGPV